MVELKRRKGDGKNKAGVASKPWPTLARQNEKRSALLEQVDRGIAVFSSSALLIDCNKAYGELYDLPKELLKSGTPLVDMLDHQVGSGTISSIDGEDYVTTHLNHARKTNTDTRIETFSDGRVMSICHIPVNGGGWITTLDDISGLFAIKEEIEHSSFYDRRTALPNKRLLLQSIDDAFAEQWEEESFALIAIDFTAFDGLVPEEEQYQLQTQIADRLAKTIRMSDVPAKLEGARFCVLLREVTMASDAEALARRLGTILAMPYQVGNQTLMPSFHMGITLPAQEDFAEELLLSQALEAAEVARSVGRRRYAFYMKEEQALSA